MEVEESLYRKQTMKRKAHVQFEANFITEEDCVVIKAKLEANAELTKDVLGKDLHEQDVNKILAEMKSSKKNKKKKEAKARKGLNVDKSAQEDSETDKEESVEAMNPTPLTTKSNSVVNWKIFQQGQEVAMQKYGTNRPEDAYDRVLWSDLRDFD
ncbi:hypothetical protein Tco_0329112 [Tanacetum coccineum]